MAPMTARPAGSRPAVGRTRPRAPWGLGLLLLTVLPPAVAASPVVRVTETGSHAVLHGTCPNGLAVLADHRPGSRTVFARIAVRVGSRDEDPRHAGISHLLEHLLFEEGHDPAGAPLRRDRNPAFSALRAVGALVNATTDFEITQYDADLPAARFDEGWEALVGIVTAADFDAVDVARERRIVLQEAALGKTDPLAIAAWSVLGKVFPDDPIGQPVIGTRRSLSRVRHDHLRAHYDRFYRPGNMFAVIVGDVDPDHAVARACGTLGAGEAEPPLPVVRRTPRPRDRDHFTFRTLTRQAYLIAAAITPGERAEEAPAFDLLSTLLGGGRTSRLHRRLVEESAITREIQAIAFQVSDIGAFGCGAAVDPDDADRARAILREEMEALARAPATHDEIRTARRVLEGALARAFDTNAGIAAFRARRMQYGRDPGRDAWRREIAALGPEDLRRIAADAWGGPAADPGAPADGIVEIRILPARGFGKVLAALRYLIFRRL